MVIKIRFLSCLGVNLSRRQLDWETNEFVRSRSDCQILNTGSWGIGFQGWSIMSQYQKIFFPIATGPNLAIRRLCSTYFQLWWYQSPNNSDYATYHWYHRLLRNQQSLFFLKQLIYYLIVLQTFFGTINCSQLLLVQLNESLTNCHHYTKTIPAQILLQRNQILLLER